MADLNERIANLTADKRKLLEALLRKRSAPAGADAGGASPETPPVISDEQFAFDTGKPAAKDDIRRFYDTVSRQLNAGPYRDFALFLNYGYVQNDQPWHAAVPLEAHEVNRNTMRLVLELVGDLPLGADHDVLDVGCGRGGTIMTLQRFFGVTGAVGVDLAPSAIAFCRRRHTAGQPSFVEGDAEQLPLPADRFDVVTSVESSHAYQDISAFYRQVARVLRPAGWFLYTDVFARDELDAREAQLAQLGFRLERRQDITSNVILSCDETAARNARAFSGANDEGMMQRFLGAPNSELYNAMKCGEQRYMIYRFRAQTGET